MSAYGGVVDAIERILNRGGDSRDVLRAVVQAMHARGVPWVAVRAGGETISAGTETAAQTVPIVYGGEQVGELEAAVDDDAFLDRVATLIAAHVRPRPAGEAWSP